MLTEDSAVRTDADVKKDELDRIKAKYRKEALKLAADAEQKGYDRGYNDALRSAEEKIASWRTVAKAFERAAEEESKPTMLVQYVVEQVYKRMKQKFLHNPTECTLPHVKDVLLECAEELMQNLPDIRLVAPASQHHGQEAPTAALVDATTHTINRPVMFRMIHQPLPPKYFIRIQIPDAAEHVVKGVFVDGEYKVYKVETEIRRINYKCIDANRKGHDQERQFVLSYAFERRHRDFRALYSQLQKEFGRLIIPELPSRPYKARSARDNTTDSRVRFRKRQFALWLQYLANIERLQISPTLITFLTGLPKLGGSELSAMGSGKYADANQGSAFKSSMNGSNDSSIATVKRSRFFPTSVSNTSAAAPSLPLPQLPEAGLPSKLDCVSECYIYARICQSLTKKECVTPFSQQALLYDNTHKNARGADDVGKDDWAMNVFSHRQLAQRDLMTADRDVAQLEPVAQAATETTHALASIYAEVGAALDTFVDSMESWRSTELEGTIEHSALSAMVDAAVASKIPMEQITESIHQECCESMEFLTGSCVRAAQETISKVTKTFPPHSFNSDVLLSSNSAMASANDGIAAAVTVAQSWECSRRLRSSMILQQLLLTAKTASAQHATMRKVWQKAAQGMRNIGASSTGAKGNIRAGLEEQEASLKDAIYNELQDCEESIQAIKESNEKASQMQDMYVKISGGMSSLRSFRAIFSRPKLPGGVRRDPKKTKASMLDSGEPDVAHEETTLDPRLNTKEKQQQRSRLGTAGSEHSAGGGATVDSAPERNPKHVTPRGSKSDANSNPRPVASPQNFTDAAHVVQGGDGDNTEEFQDQRQRQNAKRNASAATNASMRGATHKMKNPAAVNIPQHVFGAVPLPASALKTPIVAPVPQDGNQQSRSDQDISALQQAMRSGAERKERSRTSSADINTDIQHKTPSRAKPSCEPVAADLPDVPPVTDSADALPAGWQQVLSEDGSVYYYHTVTRVSRWDRPTEKVAAALEARLKRSEAEVGEAVQRRKEELDKEKKQLETREMTASKLKSKIKSTVEKWRHPPGDRLPRDLGELLSTVHGIVDFISDDAITSTHNLTVNSPTPELRKAYLKAVRQVHPDKLPEGLELEQKLLAEAVFIVLTDSFNTYMSRIESVNNTS